MPEQVVRLISTKEVQSLLDRGANHLDGELGNVFVGLARVPSADTTIKLGLKRLFGIANITVDGLIPLKI